MNDVAKSNGQPAWLAQLRSAIEGSVTADDIKQMVAAQVKKAKAGDARACKFVLDYVLGGSTPKSLTQNNFHVEITETRGNGSPSAFSIRDKVKTVIECLGPLTAGQVAANTGLEHETVQEILSGTGFKKTSGERFVVVR